MNKEIKIFPSKNDIDNFLLDLFIDLSKKEIEKKGFFSIALSGGKTPLSFYEKLSKQKDILWDKIHIFFVDERMVSSSLDNSNIFWINKLLIKPLSLKKENIHYINKELDEQDSAIEYELEIKSFLKNELPSIDFILLGIGKDGHTASIFPNTKAMREKEKLILLTDKDDEKFSRMSFSFPLINHAKNIVFLTFGDNKSEIIKKIIQDKDFSLPATHVKAKENLLFLLDEKASKFIDL